MTPAIATLGSTLRRIGRGLVRALEITYMLIRVTAMLAFIGLIAAAAAFGLSKRPSWPERFELHIAIPGQLSEGPSLTALLGGPPSLRTLLDGLYAAARDPRVTGVTAELGPGPFSLAQNQEIATALAAVRASGKPSRVWTDSFGELSPGFAAYHLASAFDEIALQPAGQLAATGLSTDLPHYGKLLAELGIEPLLGHREDYKTVQHALIYAEATGPEREMAQALIDDLTDQALDEIARRRRLARERLTQLIDGAPYTDQEALALGLVDRLAWRDEVLPPSAALIELRRYRQRARQILSPAEGTPVALVNLAGTITRAAQHGPGLPGQDVALAATRLARVIEEASARPEIRAIVLRIDSPGGSPAAAETIRRAIERATARGKPVIVSMATVAASGAYWLAAPATRIVALPATLTGSIGVAGGKLSIAPLLERHHVTVASIEGSTAAGMWSPWRAYRGDEAARRDRLLDHTYRTFLARVAEGRRLPLATVRALAQGRVWTGRQAKEQGLVDELGGLEAALLAARRALGLPDDAPLELVEPASNADPVTLISSLMSRAAGAIAATFRAAIAAAPAQTPVPSVQG